MMIGWDLYQGPTTTSIIASHDVEYTNTTGTTKGDEGKLYYDDDWSTLPYFVSTQKTAFSVTLLQNYDAELLIGQVSYKQRANIYNYVHGYLAAKPVETEEDDLSIESPLESDTRGVVAAVESRASLDRRRLEDAHLKLAVLQIISWYPESLHIQDIPLTSDVNAVLARFTGIYYNQFTAKYADHKCDTPGCHSVLVIDGNMKNHRSVCKAQDAGYVEYAGLPGAIKTGCLKTPVLKSRFCALHKPRAVATCTSSTDTAVQSEDSGTAVAQFITAKRVTRTGAHYQVVWLGKEVCKATWEPEASIPPSIIREYESGIQLDVSVQSVTYGGQTNNTLHVRDETQPPQQKKQKVEEKRVPVPDIGIYQEDEQICCNTEKDKLRLNERTAGILAGIWPCGTVTLLAELFISESKAQVYGAVHDFLHSNTDATGDIKFLCYDDGCHLRKYANNECRRSLNATTQRLAQTEIVIDRMHFKGHTDSWCRQTCDPSRFDELNEVDTEICEQTFSWLSRYARITKHMNQHHFMFFILYLCDLHNRKLGVLK